MLSRVCACPALPRLHLRFLFAHLLVIVADRHVSAGIASRPAGPRTAAGPRALGPLRAPALWPVRIRLAFRLPRSRVLRLLWLIPLSPHALAGPANTKPSQSRSCTTALLARTSKFTAALPTLPPHSAQLHPTRRPTHRSFAHVPTPLTAAAPAGRPTPPAASPPPCRRGPRYAWRPRP